jgi:excisionase family DNA binding protein
MQQNIEITQLTRSDAAETSQKKIRTKSALPVVEGGLLDTRHGAALLGISVRGFQNEVANRKIAKIQIGRNVRFRREDIEAFIEANRILPVGWKNSTGGTR